MKKTGIIYTCPYCEKEFELFCDDGCDDTTLCWNWCPYCKKQVNVWIRFKRPYEKMIPLGLTFEEAKTERKGSRKRMKRFVKLLLLPFVAPLMFLALLLVLGRRQ